MKKVTRLFLAVLFCLPLIASAQNTKGMYVNDFKNIIGDIQQEDELLAFAQEHGFNYLLLYNLHYIHTKLFDLTDPVASEPLAAFIHKAKTQYGIEEVGAVGEKFASFDKVTAFNDNHSDDADQQFDVLHIEFEYWNTRLINSYYCHTYLQDGEYTCDIAGAFQFFIDEMTKTKSLTDSIGLLTEAYIGLVKPEQGPYICPVTDRLIVHYYRKSDVYNNGNSIYNFKKDRLGMLAPTEGSIAILPVFSSRSYFMGPWLLDNQMDQAFDTYMNGQNGFMEETADWIDHIDVQGHQWYRYTDLKYYALPPAQTLDWNNEDVIEQRHQSIEQFEDLMLQLYPNPASDHLNIICNSDATVYLYNGNGQLIQSFSLNAHELTSIDTYSMANGLYILQLRTAEQTQAQKVWIAR